MVLLDHDTEVRWVTVYCATPEQARLQAAMITPGYHAHAVYELGQDCQWVAAGVESEGSHFWKVELYEMV